MNCESCVVLMIEDNIDVLHLNEKWLERAGYDTLAAETIADARKILETASPDIVILDILMPDGNGLEFLPELKSMCDAPVLFCSSRNEDKDILRGLEAGGDDYISKPYNVDILVARIGTIWNKEQKHREELRMAMAAKTLEHEILRGPLKLDMLAGKAYMYGMDTLLTPKELTLLFTLIQNEGREFSAKELYETVWSLPSNNDTRTVKKHISQLRAKLSLNENTAIAITTEYGNGYRFQMNTNQL